MPKPVLKSRTRTIEEWNEELRKSRIGALQRRVARAAEEQRMHRSPKPCIDWQSQFWPILPPSPSDNAAKAIRTKWLREALPVSRKWFKRAKGIVQTAVLIRHVGWEGKAPLTESARKRNWNGCLAIKQDAWRLMRLLRDFGGLRVRGVEQFNHRTSPQIVAELDRLDQMLAAASMAGGRNTGTGDVPPKEGGAGTRGANANARMIDLMAKKQEARYYTAEKWRVALGYKSASTIKETPAWKHLEELRTNRKAERGLKRAHRAVGRRRT